MQQPPTWLACKAAFLALLDQIEKTQTELGVSTNAYAWYRGESKATHDLNPSLFRIRDKDMTPTINRIKQNNDALRKRINAAAQQLAAMEADADYMAYEVAKKALQTDTEKWARSERQMQMMAVTHCHERGAYTTWSRQVGKAYPNSWVGLAEMQHYRVPTRLLDWTATLSTGLYFAVSKYIRFYHDYWNNTENWEGGVINWDKELPLPNKVQEDDHTPCIWILNPYSLAAKATGERRVLEPSLDLKYDYFQSFFVDYNYPYQLPIPIHPPWSNDRITAQQGKFTIHGTSKAPLNKQVGEDVVRKIVISHEAAIYLVRHLTQFCGITPFQIFRDHDRLGEETKGMMQVGTHFFVPKEIV
jgi:FRG domain